MSKRSWLLVAVVLGGGILLQIPSWGWGNHSNAGRGAMTEMGMTVSDDLPGSRTALGTRTVPLDVTGMT